MTVDLRGTAYAASRMSSTLKGSTKQFGWLQASATRSYAAPTSCDYPVTIRFDGPSDRTSWASRTDADPKDAVGHFPEVPS
jgi:hypothetical protein